MHDALESIALRHLLSRFDGKPTILARETKMNQTFGFREDLIQWSFATKSKQTDAFTWLAENKESFHFIVANLLRPHPNIAAHIHRIDIWLFGHGMIRPVPRFIWGETRRQTLQPHGPIVFDDSDMSGISILEEVYTCGRHAADTILASAS